MTNVISISHPEASEAAISLLIQGSVIALPTDTLYGLACDATNPKAINRLFDIKSRDDNKPVAICLPRLTDVSKWGDTSHLPKHLLENLLPGPVTLILPCRGKLDKLVTYKGKVGVRVPNNQFTESVGLGLNRPLALTSANVSGKPSALTAEEFSELWGKLAAVFDGGRVNLTREGSTIVDLSEKGLYQMLRSGVAESHVHEILKDFGLQNKELQETCIR